MLLGKASGKTSLLIWFLDGSFQQYLVAVHRDLSLLQSALTLIYPSIRAEIASDRDAIVLTGTVPDITYLRAAESAAHNYLDATPANGRVLIRDDQAAAAPVGAGTARSAASRSGDADGIDSGSGRASDLRNRNQFDPPRKFPAPSGRKDNKRHQEHRRVAGHRAPPHKRPSQGRCPGCVYSRRQWFPIRSR